MLSSKANHVAMYPLRVPDDIKTRWKEEAKKRRMSLNQFIILMVEERLEIK